MTIQPIEHDNQVAEFNASRDTLEATANADRLARWKARYPYRAVEVPETKEPPKWPALRSSIPLPNNVTPIKAKRGQR